MKIYNAPVSHKTQVRPAQVRDMIRHCEALQAAFYHLNSQMNQDFRKWWETQSRAQAWEMAWPVLPEVHAFREAALSNHFVCSKKWPTLDELAADHAHYLLRADLQTNCPNIPENPDFMWLRRFIHSVVIWDVSTPDGDYPLLDVARSKFNWESMAELLQCRLDQAEHVSDDSWAEVRRPSIFPS